MVNVIDRRKTRDVSTDENAADLSDVKTGQSAEAVSADQFFSILSSLLLQLPPAIMLEFMMQICLERAWTTLGLRADPTHPEQSAIDLVATKRLIDSADAMLNNISDTISSEQVSQTRTALSTLKLNYADRINQESAATQAERKSDTVA